MTTTYQPMYWTSCWSWSQFFTTVGKDSNVCVGEWTLVTFNVQEAGKHRSAAHLSDFVDHFIQYLKLVLAFLLIGLVDDLLQTREKTLKQRGQTSEETTSSSCSYMSFCSFEEFRSGLFSFLQVVLQWLHLETESQGRPLKEMDSGVRTWWIRMIITALQQQTELREARK